MFSPLARWEPRCCYGSASGARHCGHSPFFTPPLTTAKSINRRCFNRGRALSASHAHPVFFHLATSSADAPLSEDMQTTYSEDVNRGSLSGMEKGSDQTGNKPMVQLPPTGPVNQEIAVHGVAGGGGGATVPRKRVEVDMKIDVTVLHCPLCIRPFKPPVFQCKGGHLACTGCLDGGCFKWENGGAAFDIHNTAMDAVVSVARMECPHDGCERYVTYHEVLEHQSACPHAPCHCTEPGCGFAGPTPALVAHLDAAHAMPVHKVPYCKTTRIQVPVPGLPRRVLVGAGDEGDAAFLLTLGALGAATVVSAVCIRAAAACPWPRYTVKMWSNGPPLTAPATNRMMDIVLAEFDATSSTTPGAVAFDDQLKSYLTVPPGYLVGDGRSKELSLHIRIEKITS